jgi:CheY-like chemotaxis protein
MKRKILIADKDASLKDAFRIIFSEENYEIFYAASAKDVEKIASTSQPEVYIVNVNLFKSSGIEVYKKLQKDRYLDNARFFFMKDENDSTELLGFQAEGVIEKPINFFKVHERIAKDDDVIILVDEVAEAGEVRPAPVKPAPVKEEKVKDDIGVRVGLGEGLVKELNARPVASTEDIGPALESELRRVLGVTMEEMVPRLVDRMTPVLSSFVEDYTKRVMYEIAEKVIREEIDKLLKESGS